MLRPGSGKGPLLLGGKSRRGGPERRDMTSPLPPGEEGVPDWETGKDKEKSVLFPKLHH